MAKKLNYFTKMKNRISQDDGRAAEKLYAIHQTLSGKKVSK